MQKIPTLFLRNPEDMKHVLPDVNPACQWVIDGEGRATRKWDGTCIRLDNGGNWWARREVKPGRTAPAGFVEVEHDEITGKTVGWEPIYQSAFVKFWDEAWQRQRDSGDPIEPGTFELIGPKINGNPESMPNHMLVRHGDQGRYLQSELQEVQRSYDALKEFFADPSPLVGCIEGIVWHHPDGRMAKLKRRDFPTI
jgi:hypothetical protein